MPRKKTHNFCGVFSKVRSSYIKTAQEGDNKFCDSTALFSILAIGPTLPMKVMCRAQQPLNPRCWEPFP